MKIRLTFTLAAVRSVVNVNVTDSQLNILFKQQMLFHHAFDACMIICWEANLHSKLLFFCSYTKAITMYELSIDFVYIVRMEKSTKQ